MWLFKDLTTAFKDPRALHIIGWDLSQMYRDKGVTKVVGIESRGFIGGSILAYEIGAGFVPARKAGQAPRRHCQGFLSEGVWHRHHRDPCRRHHPDDVVVIHDDVLATGGTMAAVYELVKSMNPRKIYINFIIELGMLGGRKNLLPTPT